MESIEITFNPGFVLSDFLTIDNLGVMRPVYDIAYAHVSALNESGGFYKQYINRDLLYLTMLSSKKHSIIDRMRSFILEVLDFCYVNKVGKLPDDGRYIASNNMKKLFPHLTILPLEGVKDNLFYQIKEPQYTGVFCYKTNSDGILYFSSFIQNDNISALKLF
jgi:hypothetical protein